MKLSARPLEMYPNISHFNKTETNCGYSGTIFALIFSFYIVFLCSTSYLIYILNIYIPIRRKHNVALLCI